MVLKQCYYGEHSGTNFGVAKLNLPPPLSIQLRSIKKNDSASNLPGMRVRQVLGGEGVVQGGGHHSPLLVRLAIGRFKDQGLIK